MAKPDKPSDPKPQRERFIETARVLECDEDKERFEERLRQIAKTKPKAEYEPPVARKRAR
jgi:hypothetical protein